MSAGRGPGLADLDVALDEERSAFATDASGFSLLRAFALLGRIEEPALDPTEGEALVLALGHRVSALFGTNAGFADRVAALAQVLFVEEGFRGDENDYDHPSNSFLHALLRRKRGLPISLSVLTVEVARAAGIDAFGIAFPGHFLVGLPRDLREDPTDFVVVDPFHGGVPLTADDLRTRARAFGARGVELSPEWLSPASPDAILVRMLTNLHRSYARRAAHEPWLQVLTRLLWLRPRDAALFLERAQLRRVLLDDRGAFVDATRATQLAVDEALRARATHFLERIEDERRWVH